MSHQPIAHSTPKLVLIQKRPPIRETKASVIKTLSSDSEFSSDNDLSESEEITQEIIEYNINPVEGNDKQNESSQKKILVFLCLIVSLILAILCKSSGFSTQNRIEDLATKYAQQEKDFWISFQILISDSVKYNQPKCLILMYNESTAATLEHLLVDLSKYAACKITSCTSIPLIIEAHQFHRNSAQHDYGEIIMQNKNELLERGIMVVKNMETISGQSAMAFQSLCDEYQPVVPKALIVFTMKIDQHPQDKSKFVESILREKWNDLNDDIFFPLLARITNFIFIVQEKK